MLIEPAELFGRPPATKADICAPADHIAVVDGETLRLDDTVVRLLGVAAPRRGQTCHHSDGTEFDCGAASATSLSHVIDGQSVTCHLAGQDEGGTTLAVCATEGRSLNQAQVIGGWARARAERPGLGGPKLADEESEARAQHRGLWAGLFDPQS